MNYSIQRFLLTSLLLSAFAFAANAQQLSSSNLPILVIETTEDIPNEGKITADLGVVWNADGQRNYLNEGFNHYDGKIGIELRGSSSLWFDKKNYSFETRNTDGSNNNIALLGMPKENDWVLHGPYSDKSLMRNALTYILAGEIMDYAPRVRFCELIINDDYKGLYILTEKIKVDKNRVNIEKMDENDVAGDAVTGGYIMKFDKFDGTNHGGFASNYPPQEGAWQETIFQYHYPKGGDRVLEQTDYIREYIQEFEDVMASDDFAHPTDGYSKYIDASTFIDFMWMQELGRNVDGYRLSSFMYKDRDSNGGKLKMGPMWDFNLAYGNVDYCISGGYQDWAWDFNQSCPDDNWIIHFWWKKFLTDPTYKAAAHERWLELRANRFSDERLRFVIDSMKNLIGEAANRNFNRWQILGTYIWPNYSIFNTWNQEVHYLRNWLLSRVEWIDGGINQFIEPTYNANEYFDPKTYPNPAVNAVNFEYYVRKEQDVELFIYDVNGRRIAYFEDSEHFNGNNSITWNLDGVPKGIYFYQLILGNNGEFKGKILKW